MTPTSSACESESNWSDGVERVGESEVLRQNATYPWYRDWRDLARQSCRWQGFEDFPLHFQPSNIASVGVLLDFAEQHYGLGFIAWLARIVQGNDHLDVNGNDISIALDQTRSLNSVSRISHGERRSANQIVTSLATPLSRKCDQTASTSFPSGNISRTSTVGFGSAREQSDCRRRVRRQPAVSGYHVLPAVQKHAGR
jgi:hypothetical protein